MYISIHALREEGDANNLKYIHNSQDFYPRPPRGGRPNVNENSTAFWHFYPRPPRGGRRQNAVDINARIGISIHALREEGDLLTLSFCTVCRKFLSTPSARRATGSGILITWPNIYFYPRPPRGGRRGTVSRLRSSRKFLSTPSARRATAASTLTPSLSDFYPRPPRGGRPCNWRTRL